MKRLMAPWRSGYVTGASGGDECVLCEIGAREEMDRENFVLHRDGGIYVVLNRYPYINGHMMVVPGRHVADLSGLEEEELSTMVRLLVRCEKALVEGMNCMGINGGWNIGGCAGAGIEGHVHIHILPRWLGDTNFLTTVGETRVLSMSLEESYARLAPFFDGDGGGNVGG